MTINQYIPYIKRTSIITLGLFSLIIGLGFGFRFQNKYNFTLFLLVFAAFVFRKYRILLTIFICAGLFIVGLNRANFYVHKLQVYEKYYKKPVVIIGRAGEDGYYNKYKLYSFMLSDLHVDNQRLEGKVQVSGFGANVIYEGDKVEIVGKLQPGYGPYQGRISYAKIRVIKRSNNFIYHARRKFAAGLQNLLPEPLAPFALGILIGQRSSLPENVKKDLLMIGLTHIIAVSGYNLTIILKAANRLLENTSKRFATLLSVSLVILFLSITGGSASIVRAALVSMFGIAAAYYGRTFKPLLLIGLVAALTAWINPIYLWSDASWHLSFLAFFGILILSPLAKKRIRWRYLDTIIGSIALESICAEIMSTPYIVHVFGQMSRVGLLANVLIASLVPLAMLLSMIAGIAGMIKIGLLNIFAWPAVIVLSAMLTASHLLASLHGSFVSGFKISLVSMVIIYLMIIFFLIVLYKKTRTLEYVNITDKK